MRVASSKQVWRNRKSLMFKLKYGDFLNFSVVKALEFCFKGQKLNAQEQIESINVFTRVLPLRFMYGKEKGPAALYCSGNTYVIIIELDVLAALFFLKGDAKSADSSMAYHPAIHIVG